MNVAASAMAEKKAVGQRSWRVAAGKSKSVGPRELHERVPHSR